MNPWLFSFLVSLVLLVLLINFEQIKMNLYGGIILAFFMQIETILAEKLGLFEYNLVSLNMPDIFLFSDTVNIFFTGIAFNMEYWRLHFTPGNGFSADSWIFVVAVPGWFQCAG